MALCTLIIEYGVGCGPLNIFKSELKLNILGPQVTESKLKMEERYVNRYRMSEKDFEYPEEDSAIGPSKFNKPDITGSMDFRG